MAIVNAKARMSRKEQLLLLDIYCDRTEGTIVSTHGDDDIIRTKEGVEIVVDYDEIINHPVIIIEMLS